MIERLNRRRVCRNFLNRYNEKQYPALFPRLIEIAILTLERDYKKTIFTIEELEDIIYSYSLSLKKFVEDSEEEGAGAINYSAAEVTRPEGYQDSNTLCERYYYHGDGNNYIRDEIDRNYGNNFYDNNYYIPWSKRYRNEELYSKRLKNPKFYTMERNVYPHWWWNQVERNPQGNRTDHEESTDSEKDHHPRKDYEVLYPPRLEKLRKKRNKSQGIRYMDYIKNPPPQALQTTPGTPSRMMITRMGVSSGNPQATPGTQIRMGMTGMEGRGELYTAEEQDQVRAQGPQGDFQGTFPGQMVKTQYISQEPMTQSMQKTQSIIQQPIAQTMQQTPPLQASIPAGMPLTQDNPLQEQRFRAQNPLQGSIDDEFDGSIGMEAGGIKISSGGDVQAQTQLLRSGLGPSRGLGGSGSMGGSTLKGVRGQDIKKINCSMTFGKDGRPVGKDLTKKGQDLDSKGGGVEYFFKDGRIEAKPRGIRRKKGPKPKES